MQDIYVQKEADARLEEPPRSLMYINEPYIHHHYARHGDSLYDPDDKLSQPPMAKHKGRRLCFVAGVKSSGPDNSHLVELEISQGDQRQPKSCQAMFTHDFFVDSFADVLDELERLEQYSVIIVMDNVKYHRGRANGTPNGSIKKTVMLNECRTLGLDVPNASKPVIWNALMTYIDK
ncbi:hypothetical protein H310_04236 [Aphanomyces invadans]|uniref:Tc1-like transposase DDE domain-containing protein n=1 Tax=Aphanomyces invadans TaxID=157072 RepID=A0A024UI30_9STRA|nr:hypothetical protein H310_04236 [Aphanomyces invadans]ETW05278.1 hypothetical protein H310_04236 [Aphanomyces invadans]|eukprot:XP_008866716.1 hypothetical protein H310_04236 [Aphanomyces invadans]